MSAWVIETYESYYQTQGWSSDILNAVIPVPSSVYNSSQNGGLITDDEFADASTAVTVSLQVNTSTARHWRPSDAGPTGGEGPGFDWYERLHLSDSLIAFGLIPSQQQRTFTIHNAFRFQSSTVSSVTNNLSADGVTLDKSAPIVIAALTTKSIIMTVTADGTSSFDNTIEFLAASGQELEMQVTGTRLILIPWIALNGAQETIEFRTDILKAYGQEQRRALREEPVRTVSFGHVVQGNDRAKLEALLSKQTQAFCVPMWWDLRYGSAITASDTTITVDTDDSEFKDGALVFVYESSTAFESNTITTVGSGVLNLATGMTGSYTNPIVVPAFGGYLKSASGQRQENNITKVSQKYELINAYDYDEPTTVVQKDSIDVLTDKSVTVGGVDIGMTQMLTWRENGIRPGKPYAIEDRSRNIDQQKWVKSTRAEREQLKRWIYRRKGMQQPFFYPTWQDDITMTVDMNSSDTDMTVTAIENDATFYIMVLLNDATVFYRQVTVVASGGTVLTIDSSFGQTVLTTDIDRISILRLSRQASDTVTISHSLPNITRAEISITEI